MPVRHRANGEICIVEDVADLCPQMAILGEGQILVEGRPEDLRSRLDGRLWSKSVTLAEAPGLRQALPVISTRLVAGRTEIRVVAEAAPEGGFTAVAPSLEDVYFEEGA